MGSPGILRGKIRHVLDRAYKFAQIISALATAVLAILTIYLVRNNNQYVALTSKLIQQQQEPEVELAFAPPGLPTELLIRNSGPQRIVEIEFSYNASLQTNRGPFSFFTFPPSPAAPHGWREIPILNVGQQQSRPLADIFENVGHNVDSAKSSPGMKKAGVQFANAVSVVFSLQYRREVDRRLYKSHLDGALLKDSNTGKYFLEEQGSVPPSLLSLPSAQGIQSGESRAAPASR